MSNKRYAAYAGLLCLGASEVQATGLGFWEWSASSSALANANGAAATDATVAAQLPAAMPSLDGSEIMVGLNYYNVSTDYEMPMIPDTRYSQGNPIPSMFAVWQQDDWALGLAIHSRMAADIQLPEIPYLLQAQARLQPIIVSIAPSVARTFGALSVGLGAEVLYSEYQLDSGDCRLLGCTAWSQEGQLTGYSANLSLHYQQGSHSLGAIYRLGSRFSNEDVSYDLPAQGTLFYSFQASPNWQLHGTVSKTDWNGKGVTFTDYGDPFKLLVGQQDSTRLGVGAEYQQGDWTLRLGYSQDEAVDMLGGWDRRYRAGFSYALSDRWQWDLGYVYERYASKEVESGPFRVAITNRGQSFSTALRYRL